MNTNFILQYQIAKLFLALAILTPVTLNAEIHKCISNGHITFSDKPCPSKKIKPQADPKSSNQQNKQPNRVKPLKPAVSFKPDTQKPVKRSTYRLNPDLNDLLLQEARESDETEKSFDRVSAYLSKGANINHQDQSGDTALIKAIFRDKPGMVEFLIKKNADLKISNHYGKTPINVAVEKGYIYLIKIMIKRGVPVDYQGTDNIGRRYYTPLADAVRVNNTEIAALLLSKGADPNLFSENNSDSACGFAKQRGNQQMLALLNDKCDMDKILSSSERYCQDLEKKVKIHGAGVSKLNFLQKLIPDDSKSWKPLKDVMIRSQTSDLMNASARCDVDLVKWLVEHGEDPNKEFSNGKTPLLSAVYSRNKLVIPYLVKAGAKINHKNKFGHTPLNMAVKESMGETALLLLEIGADPNITGRGESIPLGFAARNGDRIANRSYDDYDSVAVVKALLEKGADPNGVKNSDGKYAGGPLLSVSSKKDDHALERAKLLIDAGADPNIATKSGVLPLTYALSLGSVEMVELVLQAGADPNLKDKQGRPVAFNYNGSPNKLALLLKHGLDVELSDKEGKTLLMVASTRNDDAVKLLLEYGASLDKKTTSGETAVMMAQKKFNRLKNQENSGWSYAVQKEIVRLLEQAGSK